MLQAGRSTSLHLCHSTCVALGSLSSLPPPENISPGYLLPRKGAVRAQRAPQRVWLSRVRARDAASGRRTRSSRTRCGDCGLRWNSTSRRRCSSATSAGGSAAPGLSALPPLHLGEPPRSQIRSTPRHLPKEKTPNTLALHWCYSLNP